MQKNYWNSSLAVGRYDFSHSTETDSYIKVANSIIKNFEPGDRILELACGTGILTNFILEKNTVPIQYLATDFSPNMIDKCRQKNSHVQFEVADAKDLEFDAKSFDHIIIANALHIMPHPEKALSEIGRVLQDDGTLFAPNWLKPTDMREKIVLRLASLFGYNVHNSFELEAYLTFLEANGFKITEKEVYSCVRELLFVACKKSDQSSIFDGAIQQPGKSLNK